MNDKVEEYKNSASVLMSVATESICWLVAAFSFVIMWCISIALEPVYIKTLMHERPVNLDLVYKTGT